MGFDALTLNLEQRKATGQVCSTSTCGCDTCPVRHLCSGPSASCDAKYCSTRVRAPVGCFGCRAVCNKSDVREQALKPLGGAEFGDVTWNSFDVEFPDVIPQINSLVYNRHNPYYVINSKKLTYVDTNAWSPQKNLRHRFKIPVSSKIAISFFTSDAWMDNYAVNLKVLAREIAEFSPDVVFGPDFSVYENYPRFDTIVNLRRRMLAIKYLQDKGVDVIPTVGWVRDEDLDRTLEWLVNNKVTVAAINLQTIAIPCHNPAWKKHEAAHRKIKEALPNCKFIVVGANTEQRIKSIMESFGDVSIIDTKSFRLAEFKKSYDGTPLSKGLKTLDLFESNLREASTLFAKVRESLNG